MPPAPGFTARPPARVGTPPTLRGHTAWHLARFATACRSSGIVLALQGYPAHADHLRRLATVAEALASRRHQPTPAQEAA